MAEPGHGPVAVRCRQCGAPVSTRGGRGKRTRSALCPACLAERPGATFAERLRSLRVAAGLTQAELAHTAHVPLGAIANYERGYREPGEEPLARLARVLGPQLLGGTRG